MKKCKNCGKSMRDSELFCPRCAAEYRDDLYREKKSYKEMELEATTPRKVQMNKKTQTNLGLGLIVLVVLFLFPRLLPFFVILLFFQLFKAVPRK